MALWSTKLCSSTLTSHQRGRVQQHFAPLVFRLASTGNLHPARPTAVYSASASLARAPQQFSIPAPPKMEWQSLAASSAELTLDFTLPTGQSFRWRRTGKAEFTGVVDNRVVKVQQLSDDVQYQVIARGDDANVLEDATVLRDYFNLQACLKDLCQDWSGRDDRFRKIHTYFPGARVLRQDPVECLFEFICSSNNHISRIHGMVERLCRDYGTPLLHRSLPQEVDSSTESSVKAEAAAEEEENQRVPDLAFYAFPTLEQLSAASEAALRAEGFGYRAKFITGAVQALLAKPGGGRQWLYSLRDIPYREASEALCELPGIGPKVAACICLFALDKHEAIPVDTHVWQLAVRYYTPHLKGKTMNKKIMIAVEEAFIERFGLWAGWAHNTLFISELASQRERLPEHLQPGGKAKKGQKAAKPDFSEATDQAEAAVVDEQVALEKRNLDSSADSAGAVPAKKRKLTAQAQKAKVDGKESQSSELPQTNQGQVDKKHKPAGSKRNATKAGIVASSSISAAAAATVDQAVEDAAKDAQLLARKTRGRPKRAV